MLEGREARRRTGGRTRASILVGPDLPRRRSRRKRARIKTSRREKSATAAIGILAGMFSPPPVRPDFVVERNSILLIPGVTSNATEKEIRHYVSRVFLCFAISVIRAATPKATGW